MNPCEPPAHKTRRSAKNCWPTRKSCAQKEIQFHGVEDGFDFVWIHPPYWNIVQYRSGANDLSNCDSYDQFRELLMVCLRRCYEALEMGGRLAVLIGDVRRGGKYTPIVKDVLNFPCGEIRSVIIKVQYNCTSDRKRYGKMEDVPIRHEYCIVFKKPVENLQALPGSEQCLNQWHRAGAQNGNR